MFSSGVLRGQVLGTYGHQMQEFKKLRLKLYQKVLFNANAAFPVVELMGINYIYKVVLPRGCWCNLFITCTIKNKMRDFKWPHVLPMQVIKHIEHNGRLKTPPKCPPGVYQLMRRCWSFQAVDRPTFEELHDIFSTDPEYETNRNVMQALLNK